MKAISTLAGVAALALAAPAHAGIVGEVRLGSDMTDLVVGRDGGAWVFIDRPGLDAVGRAGPDGSFRTAATDAFVLNGVLGPDGNAWFSAGAAAFLRAGTGGELDTIGDREADDRLLRPMAVGPDGTLWSPTANYDGFWHVTPDGRRVRVARELPEVCEPDVPYTDMVTASDGAVWLADEQCRRLVRVDPVRTTTIDIDLEPTSLAADAAGGVWASGFGEPKIAHVDASGKTATFEVPEDAAYPTDVAVAPDGSAWFAALRCRLLRVTPAGRMSISRAPIHTSELGFDPAGGMWLKGESRLAHLAPGEVGDACDLRAPSVRIERFRDKRSISLSGLRRRRGFTVRVREPATVDLSASYFDHRRDFGTPGPNLHRIVREPRGRRVRYRIALQQIRHFADELDAGHRPFMFLTATAADLEGNIAITSLEIPIRR